MNKTAIISALVAGALAMGTPSAAQEGGEPKTRGLDLAREIDARDTGFEDFVADLRMTLRNRHGEESIRQMRTKTLEMEDDGDRSLIVFDQPRDVEGTALLSFTHREGSDDQWLYLPALRRVKRIASDNKAGPFMGSEFAYEDIASQEVEKYTYRFLGDETIEGQPGFMLERVPVDPKSGYSRQVVWYDLAELRPWRVEYYDRKGDLLKTLTFSEYSEYVGEYWRASRYEMVNHQTGKSTVLEWTGYTFQTGLNERDFDQNALRRAR